MRILVLLPFGLASVLALPAPDPAMECRAAHAAEPSAHIECLERALQERDDTPAGDAASAAEAGVRVDVGDALSDTNEQRPEDFGKEQVQAVEPQIKELTLQIIGTNYNARGLGTFRTAEGQVWRETTPSPERRRLDADQQYTARIVRSKIGGYRMYVDGVRWMKTVERIE